MKKFLALIAMVTFVSGSIYAQMDTTKHTMKHKKGKMETKKMDKKKSTTPM